MGATIAICLGVLILYIATRKPKSLDKKTKPKH